MQLCGYAIGVPRSVGRGRRLLESVSQLVSAQTVNWRESSTVCGCLGGSIGENHSRATHPGTLSIHLLHSSSMQRERERERQHTHIHIHTHCAPNVSSMRRVVVVPQPSNKGLLAVSSATGSFPQRLRPVEPRAVILQTKASTREGVLRDHS